MVAIFEENIYSEYGEYIEELYQARAVAVMDARTGFVVYENNMHDLMYPASVTKIMTALLVLENVDDLQESMVFSEHAVLSLPYYASRMNVAPGDTITVYEALYGLMLRSGNEVANALAEHVSGDIDTFVALMNSRAAELGAVNTRFVNPCGLPGDGQYVTAYDMALIKREAISHSVFNEINGTAEFHVSPTESMPYGISLRNTNLMLWHEDYFNPLVMGGKTGFTNAAQHTLVSYARRGDQSFIVSVLYAPRRATFTDTAYLLDYAFALPRETLFSAARHYWQIPVLQDGEYIENVYRGSGYRESGEYSEIGEEIASVGNFITATARLDLQIPLRADMPDIRYELQIPDYLSPPVRVGEVIGIKTFFAGDELIYSVEIISTGSVLPRVNVGVPAAVPAFAEMPATRSDFSLVAFFIGLPFATFALFVVLVVLVRRHRRILRRRRRVEQARVQYARYQTD